MRVRLDLMLICGIASLVLRVPDALAQAKPPRHFVELGAGSIKGEVEGPDVHAQGRAPLALLAGESQE